MTPDTIQYPIYTYSETFAESIMGADLYTDELAAQMEGRVLSGNYIRPFTVEFGMKYKF